MSDIFLSYSSKDVARAKQLAEALTRQGWSVWWDRTILPGKIFDKVIESELAATRCVIVLWSSDSVESSWVRAEAEVAMKKGHLIPALLGEVTIPLVFRQFQAASLNDWDGDNTHAGFQQLVNAITALLPLSDTTISAAASHPTSQQSVTSENDKASARSHITTTPQPLPADKNTHSNLNRAAWGLVLILAAALLYSVFSPKEQQPAGESVVTQPPQQPLATAPSTTAQTIPAQKDPIVSPEPVTEPSKQEPAQVEPPPAKPPSNQQADPAPAIIKPAPVTPKSARNNNDTQSTSPPQTIASYTTPPAPVEVVTPLTILTVVWAMPSDKGVASDARVQDFSGKVAKTMATIMQDVVKRPVEIEYLYPDQQEHYRLLKENDGNVESQALCSAKKTTLVVSGFIQGAKFVSASYGYELTRDPVFSVFDCRLGKKISHSYRIAENNQDSYPYEQSIRKVFHEFSEQKAALNNY